MELAVSTLFCLNKSFNDALNTVLELGTKCIEVVDVGPHTLSEQRIKSLQEFKASYDFRYSVHAPYTDVNLSAYDDFVRNCILNRLEKSIKWTADLGGEIFVFHPGNSTVLERVSQGKAWKINLDSVRRLLRFSENHSVKALIENVPEPFPYVMKSVADFERFFDEVGMETGMVLDIAHANIRGENSEFIKRFGNRIGHVHVSDNFGESDTHLSIGEGSIDWEAIMKALKISPFDGWVTIESYRGVYDSLRQLRKLI
jgi:sugar phosphate isomerase/epimerase